MHRTLLTTTLALATLLTITGAAAAWEPELPAPCAWFDFPDDAFATWPGPADGRYCVSANPNCPIWYYGPGGARCYTS